MPLEGDRNILGGIVTKQWLGRFWVQISVAARDLSLNQNGQTRSGVHPASYSAGTGLLPRG